VYFIFRLIGQLFTKRRINEDDFCSIVLLLRESHFFTREEVMEAGRLGFGKAFDGKEDPMHFVVQDGHVTMLKAGTYIMHVLHQREPYLGDKDGVAKTLLLKRQKAAWLAHTTWASIDVWNKEIPNAEAYTALARFALNLADANCSAVFLPKHNILLTNDGQAEEWLHGLIRGG
jgi:hypothetical protein